MKLQRAPMSRSRPPYSSSAACAAAGARCAGSSCTCRWPFRGCRRGGRSPAPSARPRSARGSLRSGHAPGNWGRDADRRPQRFTDADAPPEMPLAESRTRSADRWPETGFLGAARAVESAVPLTDE